MTDYSKNPSLPEIQKIFASGAGVKTESINHLFEIINLTGLSTILLVILRQQLLNPRREKEWMYLWGITLKHLFEVIPKIEYVLDLHGDILLDAEQLISESHYNSAIILISTAAEHIINTFYRISLTTRGLTNNQIDDVVKISFRSKLDWLMKLMDITIPEDILCELRYIYKLRNSLVHYDAMLLELIDRENPVYKKQDEINQINYEELIEKVRRLDEILTDKTIEDDTLRKKAKMLSEYMLQLQGDGKRP